MPEDLLPVLKDVCIYPNPNKGIFYVSFLTEAEVDKVDINVFINGESCLHTISINTPKVGKELHHKVDFSGQPAGEYTVEINAAGKSSCFSCTKITE